MEHVRPFSPILHLDLNNLNSPEAEDSRYVLTSPRSLESCARLGVKPVDLLFKSLTEFIDENQGSSLEVVTDLYEEYEKGRRDRLSLCRDERQRIIQEGRAIKSSIKPFTTLETVLEQMDESQRTGKTQFSGDRIHSKSAISVIDAFQSPSNEVKTKCGTKCPFSFSLGDLRGPATEQKLKKLSQEVSRKLSIAIPEKDRKIAALMLAKYEEEQFRLRQSLFEEQHREEEQRQEEVWRAQVEQKRRRELLRRIRRWQEDFEARRRQREEEQAALAEERECETRQQEERWRRLAEEQQAQRRSKREAASREAKERKRYQERLLKEKESGEEAQKQKEVQVAHEKEQLALRSKRRKEKRDRRRLKQENQRELLKHLLLKKEVEEQERAEKELKRKGLEQKLRRSKVNHALVVEARVQDMRDRAAREEEQMRMVRQRVGQEIRDWLEQKQTLVQRCQMRMQRAALLAQEQCHDRAQRARQENQEKEFSHRRLRERVLKEEKAQWEQRCKAVARKEQRREKLLKERAEAQERGRMVGHASSYMREKVREQTCRRTFDQMAREAELTAHLGRFKL
ncbi:coiled-coil domain-containing protein 177 [Myxocyprinus asiaticus]|uniref:coiled-coil domain-containing protein 177 n=1 Tax=Myxocyprinus asiaticus TaxID=70543 RepID=UPI002221B8A9|nr:coiled-coil domain-containing protein 177 [Myxocyprinus asiaticus]